MNSEKATKPESKQFFLEIEKITDRELYERMFYTQFKIEKSNERIKMNLQFWFYFILISAVISLYTLFLNN
jgi:lipid-A-disaccharide synthase-like uncharacterized protein